MAPQPFTLTNHCNIIGIAFVSRTFLEATEYGTQLTWVPELYMTCVGQVYAKQCVSALEDKLLA